MSTIVVVRKGRKACIACDTLATIGSRKQKAQYVQAPDKIFRFQDSFIGTTGYAVHNAVLQSYFSRYPENVSLDTPGRDLRDLARDAQGAARGVPHEPEARKRRPLRDYPHDRGGGQSARHLRRDAGSRDVESFPRFWAIGSGTDFALGAMFVMYERTDDVEAIARAGVEAGAEFDDASDLPVIIHSVELVAV